MRGLRTEGGLKFNQYSEVIVIMSKIGDLATIVSFLVMLLLKIVNSKLITPLLCGVYYEKI